jgi:hypothetical protein
VRLKGRRVAEAALYIGALLADVVGRMNDELPDPERPNHEPPPPAHGMVQSGTTRVTSTLDVPWAVKSDEVRDLHPHEVLQRLGIDP